MAHAGDEGRFDPWDRSSFTHLCLLDEQYSLATLVRAVAHKLRRRLAPAHEPRPVVSYDGLLVLDRPGLHGGGLTFGQDYLRILRELGIGPVGRLFELCAGPAYIGYSLLAAGFCRELAVADRNPHAVAAAEHTRSHNRLEERVAIYESNGLRAVPATEKWDLVVGNPPHYSVAADQLRNPLSEDPGWQLHRDFYAGVKRHLNPGALVVLQENDEGSSAEVFEPMIREGGGALMRTCLGPQVERSIRIYYVVSRWD